MPDYKPPFAYAGRIKRALVDVSGTPVDNLKEQMREILARQ
jgi:arylsulfatase